MSGIGVHDEEFTKNQKPKSKGKENHCIVKQISFIYNFIASFFF